MDRVRGMTLAGRVSGSTAATAGAPLPSQPYANVADRQLDTSAAKAELSEAMTGRLTLAVVNLVILAMLGFYVWTRTAQGG